MIRTMELILGMHPLSLNDALATPMYDAFYVDADQHRALRRDHAGAEPARRRTRARAPARAARREARLPHDRPGPAGDAGPDALARRPRPALDAAAAGAERHARRRMTTRRAVLAALAAASTLPAGAQAFSLRRHRRRGDAARRAAVDARGRGRAGDAAGRRPHLRARPPPTPTDLTVQRRVTGLRAGTAYRYVLHAGHRSALRATSAPRRAPARSAPIRSRLRATPTRWAPTTPSRSTAAWRASATTSTSTSATRSTRTPRSPGATPALTVAGQVGEVQQNLALGEPAQGPRRRPAMYNHWDDHEFINDFTRAEYGSTIYDAGVKAFRDYMPVDLHAGVRHLPLVPLGPQPRGLLPRRALVPLGEGQREPRLRQPGHRRARPRADAARSGPATSSRVIEPSLAAARRRRVPRRAQRPEPHDARRAQYARFTTRSSARRRPGR